MAECCSQCLLALFISLASGPSHSQLHLSPLICLSLPFPSHLGTEEKWSPPPPPHPLFLQHIPRHQDSTHLIHQLQFHKRTGRIRGIFYSFLWHKCGILVLYLKIKICSRLLFTHVLLLYWPVWTVWPEPAQLSTLKKYLQILYFSVFAYGYRE